MNITVDDIDRMGVGRKPEQVAKRALILGTISFRSSLESTAHPRVAEISARLLPWLDEIGWGDDLDPIERDLLATPYGKLSDSQMMDANWAGEGAAFSCWMLNLSGQLEESAPSDASNLPTVLAILRPNAGEIIESTTLRDRSEIEQACRQYILIRSLLQESRVDATARDIIRRIHYQKLDAVGISVTENVIKEAVDAIGRLTSDTRNNAAGMYFVRHHAALWFLSDCKNYFG